MPTEHVTMRHFELPAPEHEKKKINFNHGAKNANKHMDYIKNLGITINMRDHTGAIQTVGLSNLLDEMVNHDEDSNHHQGETIYKHTTNVLDSLSTSEGFKALDEKNKTAFLLAGVLHDIGKVSTKLNSRGMEEAEQTYQKGDFNGHAQTSAHITEQVLAQLDMGEKEKTLAQTIVTNHHEIFNSLGNRPDKEKDRVKKGFSHVKKLVSEYGDLQTYDLHALFTAADLASIGKDSSDELSMIRDDFEGHLEVLRKRAEQKEKQNTPFNPDEMQQLTDFAGSLEGEHGEVLGEVLISHGEKPRSELFAELGKRRMGPVIGKLKGQLGHLF